MPQAVHILASEQVASFQLCPVGSPSVSPQGQFFGVVQVASVKVWVWDGSVGEVGCVLASVVGSVGDVLVVGWVSESVVGLDSVSAEVVAMVDTREVLSKFAVDSEAGTVNNAKIARAMARRTLIFPLM